MPLSIVEGDVGPLRIDKKFVEETVEDFKKEKVLPLKTVFDIIDGVAPMLAKETTLKRIQIADAESFVVVGDIHGQFYDLLHIFEMVGRPSTTNSFLFNGDFVDRGEFSLEVILTLFMYKILYPSNVTLLRGNHECLQLITNYGFSEELERKYKSSNNDSSSGGNDCSSSSSYTAKEAVARFAAAFRFLPLAAVLNEVVFVCHGGLFNREVDVLLCEIEAIDRVQEPPDDGLMCDLLWSDPGLKDGRRRSRRGLGTLFGPDITRRFLKANQLQLLVRSHEVKNEGFDVQHEGKCVTVFSAPNYCDSVGNRGAILILAQLVDADANVAQKSPRGSKNESFSDVLIDDATEVVRGDHRVAGVEDRDHVDDADVSKPQILLTGKLTARFMDFAASPHPNKDKKSLSDKLAEMGFLPKTFPY